jgi:hypothetical protein
MHRSDEVRTSDGGETIPSEEWDAVSRPITPLTGLDVLRVTVTHRSGFGSGRRTRTKSTTFDSVRKKCIRHLAQHTAARYSTARVTNERE